MKDQITVKVYSPEEERINIVSHAAGFVLSIVALVLLIVRASSHSEKTYMVSLCHFWIEFNGFICSIDPLPQRQKTLNGGAG